MQIREGIGFPSTCKVVAPYHRPICWQDPNRFYRLLGLTPAASDEDIRRAGRRLLARHHPDGPEPDEEKFLAVDEAYRCLRDNRTLYDMVPEGHVMVTDKNRNDPRLIHLEHSVEEYTGWSYFSEIPRVSDDKLAAWAYEEYLAEALATPTTLPRIAVVLLEDIGNPWVEDGLIYVPVSELRGKLVPTSGQEP